MSLGSAGLVNQDTFFRFAAVLDYNGDGRANLLMPVPPGALPEQSTVLPAWAILQAKAGAQGEATFTPVDPNIPFEAEVSQAITLTDLGGPRVGDLNGDGAADVVVPLGGRFHVFENQAPDQDLLIAVSDGMNEREPTDPAFVPNVSISYGHLVDTSITSGAAADDTALERSSQGLSIRVASGAAMALDSGAARSAKAGADRSVVPGHHADGRADERR